MTVSDPMAARAALDAARVVFGPVGSENATVGAALDARAAAASEAAQSVLHAATGRTDLTGQALIGEARRTGRLSLEDAYPLVALLARTERPIHDAAPVTAERLRQDDMLAADALRSLEHVVLALESVATVRAAKPTAAPPPFEQLRDVRMLQEIEAPRSRWAVLRSSGFIITLVCVVAVLGGVGGWYVSQQRPDSTDFQDGVAAYQRGASEVARIAFAKAARTAPNDERPLVFLGRLAREEGNLPVARRFLDAAIRVAPQSAMANRELASVMLADGNPEIARRFYVRALQIDPSDQLAQGFLGCALFRLGRPDEAARWYDRAGPGDWTPCMTAPAPTAPLPTSPATPRR